MPERKHVADEKVVGPELNTDRNGRLFAEHGRPLNLLVAGESLPPDWDEALTSVQIRMSTSSVAELTIVLADRGYKLLGEERVAKGTVVEYGDLAFRVAAIEAGPQFTITARSDAWRRLKEANGKPDLSRDTSPTEYLARQVRAAGLKFVGEPTSAHKQAGNASHGSPAKAAARYAEALGFIVFEAGGTVFFGRPTWLVEQAPRLVVPATASWLRSVPTVRTTVDDPGNAATVDLELEPEVGDRVRPGMAVELTDVPTLEGVYLVNDVTITADAATPVTVNASTAVNPEIPVDAATAAGGGSTMLVDLLKYVGFTGAGLTTAIGVVGAETGGTYDAHAVGDEHLVDAKWGPSIGLFQIRSLKRPQDYTGVDRLRVEAQLSDALYNARTAYKISAGGKAWSAWSTWPSPANSYEDNGQHKVKNWDGLPGTSTGGTSGGPTSAVAAGIRAKWPVARVIVTCKYKTPGSWAAGYHTGVDIAANYEKVWSAHPGRVVHAGNIDGYGNTVTVRVAGHDVMYCHGDRIHTRVGATVEPGTLLMTSGETGRTFGPHLHFEVRPAGASYGNQVDPMAWLPTGGISYQ